MTLFSNNSLAEYIIPAWSLLSFGDLKRIFYPLLSSLVILKSAGSCPFFVNILSFFLSWFLWYHLFCLRFLVFLNLKIHLFHQFWKMLSLTWISWIWILFLPSLSLYIYSINPSYMLHLLFEILDYHISFPRFFCFIPLPCYFCSTSSLIHNSLISPIKTLSRFKWSWF